MMNCVGKYCTFIINKTSEIVDGCDGEKISSS